jgi:hypothetical protein
LVKQYNNNNELVLKDDDEVTIQHIEDVHASKENEVFFIIIKFIFLPLHFHYHYVIYDHRMSLRQNIQLMLLVMWDNLMYFGMSLYKVLIKILV